MFDAWRIAVSPKQLQNFVKFGADEFGKDITQNFKKSLTTNFNFYKFHARARVTMTSLINFGGKKMQSVGEKDAFLQNTLPRNVITLNKLSNFYMAQ